MKCLICKKKFKEGDHTLQVGKFVTNERHGDFVGHALGEYIHLRHITEED